MKTFKNITALLSAVILLSACGKTPLQQQNIAPSDSNQQSSNAAADHTKLSREEALRLIIAKPIDSLCTRTIQFGKEELEYPAAVAPDVRGLPKELSDRHKIEIENKLIGIESVGRVPSGKFGDDVTAWTYRYNIRPLGAGRSCVTQDGVVILGNRVPLAVTGMTVPSSSPMGPTITANFNYKIVLTPYGQIANTNGIQGRPAANENHVFQGQALFVLYDDGWRVQDVTLSGNEQIF